jgi:TrmH family RNA methyltransferase
MHNVISKNDVKYIQSLYQKKNRDSEGLFIAEGPKLVNELLQAGFVVKKIYAHAEWAEVNGHLGNVTIVLPEQLEKLSALQTPNQVLAVAEKNTMPGEPQLKGAFSLVLDGIQDPGNMGTILRIADWFGITQVIASTDTADVYNPKVVQATMGSITRVNVWYKQLQPWLQTAGVPVYAALLDGLDVCTVGKVSEGVLIIGNEGRGIRPDILPFIQKPVTIKGRGGAESLNAAVATGIILSHIV